MPIKKSELYSSLWESCDELRSGMDASQYKDYVLVLLFVKYVSDKYAGQKDALLDVPATIRPRRMMRLPSPLFPILRPTRSMATQMYFSPGPISGLSGKIHWETTGGDLTAPSA